MRVNFGYFWVIYFSTLLGWVLTKDFSDENKVVVIITCLGLVIVISVISKFAKPRKP